MVILLNICKWDLFSMLNNTDFDSYNNDTTPYVTGDV